MKKKKVKQILCIKCDCYVPRWMAKVFPQPQTRSEPWFKGVKFTGQCKDCEETKFEFEMESNKKR